MKYCQLKNIAMVVAMFFLLAVDRFFKILAYQFQISKILFQKWLSFHFTANKFIAFSLPLINSKLLIFLILVIVVFLTEWLILSWRQGNYLKACFLLLILAGAVSNLWDRLAYGFVIDYIDVSFFTVFNLADAMIVFGVAGVLFLLFFCDCRDEQK